MILNSCTPTSANRWYLLSGLQASFYVVLFIICAASVSCSPSQISYLDHCSSIVPEFPPTLREFSTLLFPGTQNGYCHGGDRILSQDSSDYSASFSKLLAFQTRKIYRTEAEGVFKVEGTLNLQSNNRYYYGEDLREMENSYSGVLPTSFWGGSVTFLLHGFWSESSGKLCMVGTGSAYSREGELLDLAAVLKLNNVKNLSTVTDLVGGTLESLNLASDSNYFEPISMLVFPQMNYKYTLVSEVGLESNISICSMLSRPDNWFELEYPLDCYSLQNCTSFGGEIGYLPHFINIKASQCSEDERRLKIMIKFHNFSYVDYNQLPGPNMTLIGEGWWDAKNNRLCVVACRILNTMQSLANAHIGDCSIRLSLRFPAIWLIRSRSNIVGQIWSNKTVDDSGYFNRIMFQSPENIRLEIPGLKYEYTEIDKAGKLCQKKKCAENKGERYPNPNDFSFDMQFDMMVKNSTGVMAWGSAAPFFVGDNLYDPFEYGIPSSSSEPGSSVVEANARHISPVNISYKISFTLEPGAEFGGIISPFSESLGRHMKVDISAEGIYDAKTGGLCMVGCRRLSSKAHILTDDSVDCEILVNLQFPPLGSGNEGYIKGSIESTREKSDPLYFKRLDLSSTFSSKFEESWFIGRMELEIIMVLMSNTLTCFFVGLQLLHVKKSPEALPSISLAMLVILTFGFMIPLVMNFEALFLGSFTDQNVWLDNGRWFKLNNLLILAAFLLQFCLLHFTLSVKLGDGKQKGLWAAAEKNALYLSSPLYIAGCLISIFLNCEQNNLPFSHLMNYQLHSLWRDLRSCSGLVLDWFLLPQILLNLFIDSREKALSHAFYIGTTSIRLLPHAYELYSSLSFARGFDGSWSYANPGAGFYTTAWNAMIPCGSLLFAVVLFLQQKYGGLCILPKRLKGQKYVRM